MLISHQDRPSKKYYFLTSIISLLNQYHWKMPIIWLLWKQGCSQSCSRFRPRHWIYALDWIYTALVHLNANNCPRQFRPFHPLPNVFPVTTVLLELIWIPRTKMSYNEQMIFRNKKSILIYPFSHVHIFNCDKFEENNYLKCKSWRLFAN